MAVGSPVAQTPGVFLWVLSKLPFKTLILLLFKILIYDLIRLLTPYCKLHSLTGRSRPDIFPAVMGQGLAFRRGE